MGDRRGWVEASKQDQMGTARSTNTAVEARISGPRERGNRSLFKGSGKTVRKSKSRIPYRKRITTLNQIVCIGGRPRYVQARCQRRENFQPPQAISKCCSAMWRMAGEMGRQEESGRYDQAGHRAGAAAPSPEVAFPSLHLISARGTRRDHYGGPIENSPGCHSLVMRTAQGRAIGSCFFFYSLFFLLRHVPANPAGASIAQGRGLHTARFHSCRRRSWRRSLRQAGRTGKRPRMGIECWASWAGRARAPQTRRRRQRSYRRRIALSPGASQPACSCSARQHVMTTATGASRDTSEATGATSGGQLQSGRVRTGWNEKEKAGVAAPVEPRGSCGARGGSGGRHRGCGAGNSEVSYLRRGERWGASSSPCVPEGPGAKGGGPQSPTPRSRHRVAGTAYAGVSCGGQFQTAYMYVFKKTTSAKVDAVAGFSSSSSCGDILRHVQPPAPAI